MPVTQGGRFDLESHLLLSRFFIRPSHQVSGENMEEKGTILGTDRLMELLSEAVDRWLDEEEE